MISPPTYAGHGRFQAVRGRRAQRLLWASLHQQTQRAAARPVEWMQQQRQQQHALMRNPLPPLPRRSSSFSHVGASIRCSATATAADALQTEGATATARQPYTFKSAAHRDMVVLSTRLHLLDLLLQRFGRLRTAECCLLREASSTPRLLLLWADLLVEKDPEHPPADAYFVPPELYRLPEVKVSNRSRKRISSASFKRRERTTVHLRAARVRIDRGF